MRLALVVLLLVLPVPATAAEAVLVSRTSPHEPARDGSVLVTRGQSVELFVLVHTEAGWFGALDSAIVGGRRISIRPWNELGPARVSWRKVEPRMRAYTNAQLLGRRHGNWHGYAQIEYFETPVEDGSGAGAPRRLVADSRPSDPALDVRDGLGTLRWSAVVTTRDGPIRAPGPEATTPTGIDDRVLRISFRGGDDFPGWLSAYFNVPQVFGSAGGPRAHQTDRFVGADCADVLVGALRAAGKREIAYTSVAGLSRYARAVSGVVHQSATGRLDTVLRWGRDVRPGDIVVLDYTGFADLPRPWDHVGVLARDDGDGALDADDVLYHMGLETGLTVEPLRAQGAVRLRVLRLLPRFGLG